MLPKQRFICMRRTAHRNFLIQSGKHIAEGVADGCPHAQGTMIFGVPVGNIEYIQHILDLKGDKIVSKYATIAKKLHPSLYPEPEYPCRQAHSLIVTRCLQFQGNYWARHVPPKLLDDFASKLDNALLDSMSQCTGVLLRELSPFSQERTLLSMKQGGLGLKLLDDVRHAEWIGGFVQGTSTLIHSTDQNGNCKRGRAHIPSIVNMLGEGSFDVGTETKWEKLLERVDCPFAESLRYVHDATKAKAIKLGTDANSKLICNQPLHSFGFDHEGKRPASSTHAISKEMDEGRAKKLRDTATQEEHSTNMTLQESLSLLHADRFTTLPLMALPNKLGFMADNLFPEIVAQIMGQPSPVCKNFEGHWIGSAGNEQPVDVYGNSVASARFLPGGDYHKASRTIQLCLLGMAKQAGLTAYIERNWILCRLGATLIPHSIPQSHKWKCQSRSDYP